MPAPVRSYADHVLPRGCDKHQAIEVDQVGEMVLKPGARPRRFQATETFEVDRVAFRWQARFPAGIRVVDRYDGRDGSLEVRLLGLRVQRSGGPQLAVGEAFRYLAELAWAPQAIRRNAQLEWQDLGDGAVEVATRIAAERIAVRFEFDANGLIARTVAQRPRLEAGNAITPWIGEYHDYRRLNGVLVPTRADVRWELPEGPYTYWRATILSHYSVSPMA